MRMEDQAALAEQAFNAHYADANDSFLETDLRPVALEYYKDGHTDGFDEAIEKALNLSPRQLHILHLAIEFDRNSSYNAHGDKPKSETSLDRKKP